MYKCITIRITFVSPPITLMQLLNIIYTAQVDKIKKYALN